MPNNPRIGIPELFHSVSQTIPSSTCCCIVNEDAKEDDTNERRSRILTYEGAWDCIKWHQAIIQNIIAKLTAEHDEDDDDQDIVIAFLSGNSIDMLLSMIACTSIPAPKVTIALLNTRWTSTEMVQALKSKSKNAKTILLYGPSYGKTAHRAIQQLSSVQGQQCDCIPISQISSIFFLSPTNEDKLDDNVYKFQRAPIHNDNVSESIQCMATHGNTIDAFIVFTSGTSGGGPKGARLSHRAIIVQSLAKLGKPCSYSSQSCMLASTVPLFHIGGLSSCLAVLFAGGQLFFPPTKGGSFSASMVRNSLQHPVVPINTLVVVPAMLATYFADESQTRQVYDHVQLILIGGQSAPPNMIANIESEFPRAKIVQTYACTEAASSLTFLHINDGNESSTAATDNGDCVGIPPSHIQLQLYSKDPKKNKRSVTSSPNEVGIIATKGPHLMNGYWDRGGGGTNHEGATGWYSTSDLGSFDPNTGQLYFRGRIKDVIRTGGETVFAQEVEKCLIKHPSIRASAVFPKQDLKFGEAVACAIVPVVDDNKEQTTLGISMIKEWCKQRGLATYKRPRYVFLVDGLPQNSSGKVLKHALIEAYGQLSRSKL